MNKYEVIKKIEDFASAETQEKWDCCGWLVDNKNTKINKILFALTVTDNIIEQAKKNQCDMIISHHPLFFVPLKYSDINIYCAHTNMDKACGGTTDLLIKNLGLEGETFDEFVRIVKFQDGISVSEFRQILLKISSKLRYINNNDVKKIYKIGFCAGSGSEFIKTTPCDAFVTGDLKFHTAIESDKVVFDIGHFESEIGVVNLLKELCEVGKNGVIADEKSPFI